MPKSKYAPDKIKAVWFRTFAAETARIVAVVWKNLLEANRAQAVLAYASFVAWLHDKREVIKDALETDHRDREDILLFMTIAEAYAVLPLLAFAEVDPDDGPGFAFITACKGIEKCLPDLSDEWREYVSPFTSRAHMWWMQRRAKS